jgi:hypothetical protein
MTGRLLIAVTLVGVSLSILGAGTPASGALRLDTGAVIQADAQKVDHIEEAFNRAEDAIGGEGPGAPSSWSTLSTIAIRI